jgi:hypothetical protein
VIKIHIEKMIRKYGEIAKENQKTLKIRKGRKLKTKSGKKKKVKSKSKEKDYNGIVKTF